MGKNIPQFGEKIDGIAYRERTGAYAAIIEADKSAVVRTRFGYFLAGGGIEVGETQTDALSREIIEETGYEAEICEYIGSACGYYYSQDFESHMFGRGHFYKVRLLKKVCEPVETDHELVYIDNNECIKLLNYDYQRWAIIEALKKQE